MPLRIAVVAVVLIAGAAVWNSHAAENLSGENGSTVVKSTDAKVAEETKETNTAATATASTAAAPTNDVTSHVSTPSTNAPAEVGSSKESQEDSNGTNRRDRRRRDRDRDRASGVGDGGTTATNAPNRGTDFAAFRIITDRNIFSPNRTTPSSRTEAPKEPKIDSFSLVGTMSYDKGDFAFFDGSGSEYRKALKVADTIGGHKIVSIAADEVVVQAGEKPLTLRMGSQLRRVDDGPWELRNSSAAVAASKSAESSSSSESGSGGSEDEILQRLLKKREQEMNNEKR